MGLHDAGDDVQAHAHATFFLSVKQFGAMGERSFAEAGSGVGDDQGEAVFVLFGAAAEFSSAWNVRAGIDEELLKSLGQALGSAFGMTVALEYHAERDHGMLLLSREAWDGG